ncbi:MAG: RluA family pseudouridine synthase [Sphaerochaetaceae bacterium]|nr:RluA family pseudouridine synthase [Sphaerochaetaceae bacterium]
MTKILPSLKAEYLCLSLMDILDTHPIGKTFLLPNCGRMFGVLICEDNSVLYSVSGDSDDENLSKVLKLPFVSPCYDKKNYTSICNKYNDLIKGTSAENRKLLSRECWEQLKSLYSFYTFNGSTFTFDKMGCDIPSGSGDCCEPRLLSHCFKKGLKPVSMACFFYGNGTYPHKAFTNPCEHRCKNLLKHIIGLDVVYLDSDIIVVNKDGGLLAIEGKGPDKKDCVSSRVRNLYNSIFQPCIHRLDQSTSGLMVLGLTQKAHDILSKDFENRNVFKAYEAIVHGLVLDDEGTIELPIRLDVEHRPYQIVDFVSGKKAETIYRRLSVEIIKGEKCTRLYLEPKTGRTHQLRLHCSSNVEGGLGCSILGDSLYGDDFSKSFSRLYLQARILEFTHPITKEYMKFSLPVDF